MPDYTAREVNALLRSTLGYRALLLTTSLHFGPHLIPLFPRVNSKNPFFEK